MEEGEQAGYDVYYYYTSAASASQAAAENTFPVRSGTFDREVSAGIYVPNIKNHLYVRKTDTEGNPLDGAVICPLYRAAPGRQLFPGGLSSGGCDGDPYGSLHRGRSGYLSYGGRRFSPCVRKKSWRKASIMCGKRALPPAISRNLSR